MIDIIDITPFNDFNLFFAWYMNIIKSKVEGYNVVMSSKEIHIKFGLLTKEEKKFTDRMIRKIQKIPKDLPVIFTNRNDLGTFASRYNGEQDKAEIFYPSVTYYLLRFPSIVKAAIQHEVGHIYNGDIIYRSAEGEEYQNKHSGCINRSMDCRINQNLNYQTLDYTNRCLFTFSNSPTELIVPKIMFPKIQIPLALAGKVRWTYIHDRYHSVKPEPLDENEENFELKIGTYVKTNVDKNNYPIGTYGRIYDSLPTGYGVYEYFVMSITDEEIQALIDEDDRFFENFYNDPISNINGDIVKSSTFDFDAHDIGQYKYNKELKEITIIPKPIDVDNPPPQVGDIALAIEDIGSIPNNNFATITEIIDESKRQYKLVEFSDEIQQLIRLGKADAYFEKMNIGENIYKNDNYEIGIWRDTFILKNLSPTSKTPPPPTPPQDTKQKKRPKVGDIVNIKKGESSGKYGVIQDIDAEGKYIIKEVSEEIAKSMVSKI